MDPTIVLPEVGSDQTVVVDDSVARHVATSAPTVIVGAPSPPGVGPEVPTIITPRPARGTHVPARPTADEVPVSGGALDELPVSGAALHEVPARSATLVSGASTSHPTASPTPPAGVRYVVVGMAGKGGMGVVHVARDVGLLRRVALKELTPDAAGDDGARARFVREVQVTAQLDHPHIVPVYSLEVAEGDRPAYAMKLVEGRTFVDLVNGARALHERGEPIDDAHALHTRLGHFLKVCEAVAYAHARGVVHRDLKPANLMLGAHHEVYVMDWGLCRLVGAPHAPDDAPVAAAPPPGADASATACGTIVGTPRYMSPEQARGENAALDARSDEYSLGAILLELVTLRPPVAGRDPMEVLGRVAEAHHAPVTHAFGDPVPAELVAIIDKAMSAARDDRYASVGDMAEDLRRYLRGEAVLARPDTAWQAFVRRVARHRQRVAIALLALVALSLFVTIGLLWRHERAVERERRQQQRYEAFVAEATRIGDVLQRHLLDARDDLDTLAATMGLAAQHAVPVAGDLPWATPGAPLPAGAERAGVFVRYPGAAPAEQDALARRIARADARRQQLITGLQVAFGDRARATATEAEALGLRELRAGFAAGLLHAYPAAPSSASQPDPRDAEWYRHAIATEGLSWTVLADDGDEDVNDTGLAIAAAVRDDEGRAIGAVGMVLGLERFLSNLVPDCRVASEASTALIEPGGRVLAACDLEGHVTARTLGVFARPEVRRAIEAAETGTLEVGGPQPQVVAFDRLRPMGWTLVRAISRATLLGER